LEAEYAELKNNSSLQSNYGRAVEILREIDNEVRSASPIDVTKGILVLPWIDREAIDREHGIECELLSPEPNPITWKTSMESIDDATKAEMKNSYERAIYCIRALAAVSENLYNEKDLKMMTKLHSKLVNNKDVSYTPRRVYSAINDSNHEKELKSVVRFYLRHANETKNADYNEKLQLLTELVYGKDESDDLGAIVLTYLKLVNVKDVRYIDRYVLNAMINEYGDGRNYPDTDPQTRLDLRRYDLIINDYFGHQARRKNGDMLIGDMILPWVEVPEK
jgi:hypothetical protein